MAMILRLISLGMMMGSLTAAPPNVVVFLADDAGWGDYGHSGNTTIATPNIDSLAKDGVALDRFFVCPVCSPTRAEFLTGRYHPRTGVSGVSEGKERLNLDEKTLADAFKGAGYATGIFGKWHNGSQWPYHPLARGFDEFFGYTSGHWGEYMDPPLEQNGIMLRQQGYIVDVCTDKALAFIERNKARAFFCYIPFTTPHTPWRAPDPDWARFKDRPIKQTGSAGKEIADQTRCALAMIENQDMNVGRVLTKLNECGLSDRTIVVYFSDNGPNTYRWNGGMKGKKGSTDEGGLRSVCYFRWPGSLPANHTVTEICGAIDLLPTLTSLAKVARVGAKPLDGRDLTPLLMKQQVDWPEREIFSTWAGKTSIRTPMHRLDSDGNLYDMIHDPGQATPIQLANPAMADKLSGFARKWIAEMPRERVVRPFPVGYRDFPITMLDARDGVPHGSVKRSGSAPNCSYFVNWTRTDDRLVWLIEVHEAGRYEVTMDYTCPLADAGSTVQWTFGNATLTGKVEPGWDPPLYKNQDTLPRDPQESRMKEFKTLKLGVMPLRQGSGELILRALDIPGKSVMDLRRITLTLLP